MECYRVQLDPTKLQPKDQFPGWPVTIKLSDNRGQQVAAYLPPITAPEGVERPVLRVSDAESGELVYAIRLAEPTVKPWVYSGGEFLVEFGDPDTDRWTVAKQVVPAE